jgi:dephospho-CoA kinase
MSERTILQITGEADAGKSDLCTHLAKEYGFRIVPVSTLGPRGDYLAAHKQMKEEQGVDIVAKTILELPAKRICVDGIRVVNDVERLRMASGVMSKVVALHCPPELRFERAQQRRSGLDRLTFEEFLEDDLGDSYNLDLEHQNTAAVIGAADYHIDASQPQELVFSAVDEIIERILDNSNM